MEFSGILHYISSFETKRIPDKCTPPTLGVKKVNCDAVVMGGRAALAFVARDESGLLVVARTKFLCFLGHGS